MLSREEADTILHAMSVCEHESQASPEMFALSERIAALYPGLEPVTAYEP